MIPTTSTTVTLSFRPMIAVRKRVHVSQSHLASLIGLRGGSAISNYERGRRCPSAATLVALAVTLGVPLHDLFRATIEERKA